jgi:hypothetical protein
MAGATDTDPGSSCARSVYFFVLPACDPHRRSVMLVSIDATGMLMPSSLLRIPHPYWLALALAFCAGSAAAAIYKWVDENGVTQYSEKPPPGKKPAEVPIRSQPTPATPQGPQSGSKTWQQQEAEFQQGRIETIVSSVDPNVDWQTVGRSSSPRTKPHGRKPCCVWLNV